MTKIKKKPLRKNPLSLSIDNIRRWAYLNIPKYSYLGFDGIKNQAIKYFGRDTIYYGENIIIENRIFPRILIFDNTLKESVLLYFYIFSHPNISRKEKNKLWRYTMIENPILDMVNDPTGMIIKKIYHPFNEKVLEELNIEYKIYSPPEM